MHVVWRLADQSCHLDTSHELALCAGRREDAVIEQVVAVVLCEDLSRAVIGPALLLFFLWLVLSALRVRALSSNRDIRKLCSGRGMRQTWLDSDSPVFDYISAMDLLRSKEGGRRRLLVLAVVFECLAFSRCFGNSQDSELTFLLPPGRSECFFQTAVTNGTMEVEYQVTVCMQHISYKYTHL